jgi:hypothetical protein
MELKIKSKKYGEQIIIIDDEDHNKIKNYIWHVAPSKNGYSLYAKTGILKNGKRSILKMHRLLMNFPENKIVDHINTNSLDNRKENLRICTNQENQMNGTKRMNGTSKYKGVYFDKSRNKFVANIMKDGKKVFTKRFDTEDQAAIAYNIAALKYFGEFARPNINIMMQ